MYNKKFLLIFLCCFGCFMQSVFAASIEKNNKVIFARVKKTSSNTKSQDINRKCCNFACPKNLGIKCNSDVYFNASFLMFKAREDGLEYSIVKNPLSDPIVTLPFLMGRYEGFFRNNQYAKFNYGFRVNFGKVMKHDNWNIDFIYSYFRIKNDASISLASGVLFPLWLSNSFSPTENCTKTSANWKAYMHSADISIIKPYHITKAIILNPNFGVRFGFIPQRFTVINYGTFNLFDTTPLDDIAMKAKNDFWGIGSKLGFKTEYNLGTDINIFVNANVALLYSNFKVSQEVDKVIDYLDIKRKFHTALPNYDLSIGLNWKKLINDSKQLIHINLAYEIQAWLKQNYMRRVIQGYNVSGNLDSSNGNLFLNGLDLNIGLSF